MRRRNSRSRSWRPGPGRASRAAPNSHRRGPARVAPSRTPSWDRQRRSDEDHGSRGQAQGRQGRNQDEFHRGGREGRDFREGRSPPWPGRHGRRGDYNNDSEQQDREPGSRQRPGGRQGRHDGGYDGYSSPPRPGGDGYGDHRGAGRGSAPQSPSPGRSLAAEPDVTYDDWDGRSAGEEKADDGAEKQASKRRRRKKRSPSVESSSSSSSSSSLPDWQALWQAWQAQAQAHTHGWPQAGHPGQPGAAMQPAMQPGIQPGMQPGAGMMWPAATGWPAVSPAVPQQWAAHGGPCQQGQADAGQPFSTRTGRYGGKGRGRGRGYGHRYDRYDKYEAHSSTWMVPAEEEPARPLANVPVFLDQAVEDTVAVPKALLGKVIGKQAQTIIEIREKSGAFKVDARDQNSDPCLVKVAGTEEAVAKARELINELITSAKAKNTSAEYVEIPRAKIGMVIGLKGSQVNDIQMQTGTKIDVDFETDPCKCYVKGTPEAIEEAKRVMLTIAMQIEDDKSEYMELPKTASGALIGASGFRVREFQAKSGALIHVDKTGSSCRVRLTGSQEQVGVAKMLIVEEVEKNARGLSRNQPIADMAPDLEPMVIPAHQPTTFPATLSESIARAKAAAEAVRSGLIAH